MNCFETVATERRYSRAKTRVLLKSEAKIFVNSLINVYYYDKSIYAVMFAMLRIVLLAVRNGKTFYTQMSNDD